MSSERRAIREGQRDTATIVATSVATLCLKAAGVIDPETYAALTGLCIVLAHRWMPDMASRA